MKRLSLVSALCVGGLVAIGCATGETDVGQGTGGFAGTPIWDGGGTGGQGGSGAHGLGGQGQGGAGGGVGGAAGASGASGASGVGGVGGSSGIGGAGGGVGGAGGGVGGSSGVGGSTGGSGGAGGSVGGSSGVGGTTGGTGGSVGGSSGSGGSGGVGGTGGTGGTGGGTVVPATCGEAHGSVGCCAGNDLYFWECAKMQGGTCAQGCGWDATNKWYACGFSGADPSGAFPKNCGAPNPVPAQCPGTACCAGNCGSGTSPSGCACDSLCSFFGDCCLDACPVCGIGC